MPSVGWADAGQQVLGEDQSKGDQKHKQYYYSAVTYHEINIGGKSVDHESTIARWIVTQSEHVSRGIRAGL